MAQWATFVWLTGVVLTLLLALARLSQRMVRGDPARISHSDPVSVPGLEPTHDDAPAEGRSAETDDRDPQERVRRDRETDDTVAGPNQPDGVHPTDDHQEPWLAEIEDNPSDQKPGGASAGGPESDSSAGQPDLSTGALLANVALTQGLFGAILVAGAWYAEIPARAFGITAEPLSTGLPGLALGIAFGVALYAANELGAASADSMGIEYDERLRHMLAPASASGWVVLLLVVLPVIAGVEEFIFRAAVIGATSAGFGTSPWALAVVSSIAFAVGHGAQGKVGVVVTGALGFVLAAAFVLTGSLLVVFVAHYLVNALEFVVHELLGIDDWVFNAVGSR